MEIRERKVTVREDVELRQAGDYSGDVPNAETPEAIEEVRRMKADPSLGKAYTDIKQMFAELLSDV